MQRHRALRWLAPAGVVGVATLVATGLFKDTASSESLPAMSPASLLSQVQTAKVTGLSGTVVSTLNLGLPELPGISDVGGTGSSLSSLLSGSHTMRVWFGGVQQQRVALLGTTDETDVFRNGRSLWEWSSSNHTALHLRLPADLAGPSLLPTDARSLSPSTLAQRAIDQLDPSTKVQVRDGDTIADRTTYQLILTPRTASTRVGSVHISVDGVTKVPLAVQVFARGTDDPALDVAFTSVRFVTPPARNFTFSPPSGATVRKVHASHPGTASGNGATHKGAEVPRTRVVGKGWTRIVETRLPKAATRAAQRSPIFQTLTPVAGTWGSGRLLSSNLVNVLLTDDGHVYAGAVPAASLYAAAAHG